MEKRFVKSLWAAEVARKHGYKVTPAKKPWYPDPYYGPEPVFSQEGYIVEASRRELLNLGLKSSHTIGYV